MCSESELVHSMVRAFIRVLMVIALELARLKVVTAVGPANIMTMLAVPFVVPIVLKLIPLTGLLVEIARLVSISTAKGVFPSRMALMLTRINILILFGAATFMVRPVLVMAAIALEIGVMISLEDGIMLNLLFRTPVVNALLGIPLTDL